MPNIDHIEIDGVSYELEDETARLGLPVANPVLTGTEESLNGLQIGNDKYKISGSGVHITTIEGVKHISFTSDNFNDNLEDILDESY